MSKKLVYHMQWLIGAHTQFQPKNSNKKEELKNPTLQLYETLYTGIKYGMYAIQFFMGNPKSVKFRTTISDDDIKLSQNLIKKFPLRIFTHFPYTANLSGSKKILAWNGDETQDNSTLQTISALEKELNTIARFRSRKNGVVIHPGNHIDRKKGLNAIIESIKRIEFSRYAKLLLENSAGQGTSLATTLEEIAIIINGVDNPKNIGVCIDTCHIFAYGDYDISKISEMKRLFDDFDSIIGLKYLTLIHLNDSETVLGSKVDRHARIGYGHIWHKNFESLLFLLEKCNKLDIPLVLETHGIDMLTMACL